ncbi:MAG TPA: hypothetical protein PKZ24_08255, partial [Nitrospirales bacterium]|nr:hypothetical protein [Nitrospirales bacterium]
RYCCDLVRAQTALPLLRIPFLSLHTITYRYPSDFLKQSCLQQRQGGEKTENSPPGICGLSRKIWLE